jgi:hypothetical protein
LTRPSYQKFKPKKLNLCIWTNCWWKHTISKKYKTLWDQLSSLPEVFFHLSFLPESFLTSSEHLHSSLLNHNGHLPSNKSHVFNCVFPNSVMIL